MFKWLQNFLTKKIPAVFNGTANWTILFSGNNSTRVILSRSDLERLFYGWTYACVSARAEDVGEIDLKLYKKGKRGFEEIESHPLLDMLHRINATTTKDEGFALLSMHLDIFGKGYWRVKEDPQNSSLKIIQPLMPDSVVPVVDEDDMIIAWKISRQGQEAETVELNEIIPFRMMNPFNINGSYSVVQAAYEWIQTELNATNWNLNFFANNAIPAIFLKSETPINEPETKRLRTSFEEQYGGLDNAHKTGLLPPGVSVEKISDSMKDMDFSALDERYQNKILAMFKMPRTRLGITDDVNRANAEATNYVYALRSIRPQMRKIVNALNEFLVPMFGDDLVLDFVSPVPEDEAAELLKYQAGLGTQPFLTVNEVREQEGLAPVKGGDQLMTTLQYVPLSSGGSDSGGNTQAAQKPQAAISKNLRVPQQRAQFQNSMAKAKEAGKTVAKEIFEALKANIEGFASAELDDDLHKQFVRRGDQYEKGIKNGVQKINDRVAEIFLNERELRRLMDAIGNKDFAALEKGLFDKKQLVEIVINGLTPPLSSIAEDESKHVQANFGISDDYEISDALDADVGRFMKKLGRSYADSTVSEIQDEIESGLEDGLNIREIKRNLKDNVFDGSMSRRAEMIARSEVYRFANLGLRDGYRESGVVQSVRWYTAGDERVCEFCGPLNGKTVNVDKNFFDEGQSVIGEKGGIFKLDYSEIEGGPLHPQCRCYVRPDKISIL